MSQDVDTGVNDVIYSAQVRCQDGQYMLTVSDRILGTEQVFPVTKRAVDQLPKFLTMLQKKLR